MGLRPCNSFMEVCVPRWARSPCISLTLRTRAGIQIRIMNQTELHRFLPPFPDLARGGAADLTAARDAGTHLSRLGSSHLVPEL